MAEALSVGGLASGLDTNSIIDGLTDLEMVRVRKAEASKLKVEDKLEAFDKLQTRMGDFASTAEKLSSIDAFNVFSNESSDSERVTIDGDENAVPGSFDIEVESLATKLKVTSDAFASQVTAFGFSGSFEVSKSKQAIEDDPINTKVEINVAATDTLKDIVNKINGNEGIGVQASIISLGENDFRLVLSAVDEGTDGFTLQDTGASNILDAGGFNILQYNQSVHSDFNLRLNTLGAADSSTLFSDIFTGIGLNTAIDNGDQININGVDALGNTVSGTYTYTAGDTINELLTTVKSVYESAGATVQVGLNTSGEVVITDLSGGVNEMEMQMAFNDANASGSKLSLTAAGDKGKVQNFFNNVLSEGKKAFFRVDGLSVASESNKSSNVVTGATFNLLKAGIGETINVTLERDNSGIKTKIQEFLDGFNAIVGYITEQSKVQIKEGSGPNQQDEVVSKGAFASDSSISRILNELRNLVTNSIPELATKSPYTSLASIGITSSTSDGTLSIDEEKFNKAINSDFEGVRRLFVVSGSSDNPEHKFGRASFDTKTGVYQIDADNDLIDSDESAGSNLMLADRVGTILTGKEGSSKGLSVEADIGSGFGNMTFIRGIAGQVSKFWKDSTDNFDGYLTQTRESIEKRIETFQDRIERLTEQADRFRQNLIRQFANLETAMSKLQSQSSAFQAQIGALG